MESNKATLKIKNSDLHDFLRPGSAYSLMIRAETKNHWFFYYVVAQDDDFTTIACSNVIKKRKYVQAEFKDWRVPNAKQ